MIRIILILASLSFALERTRQDVDRLVGKKGEQTHLYDLYKRTRVFSVAEYGAAGTCVQDDTEEIARAFTAAAVKGGIVYFPKPDSCYLISGDIGLTTGITPIHVIGEASRIKRAPTNVAYNMFRFRSNMTIEGIDLEGYIASGTGESNVVPQWGMGFRSGERADNVQFRNTRAFGHPFDGFYVEDEHDGGHVTLLNCSGFNNFRNDFAATRVRYVEIDGGTWADDDSVITKNASIDFEPDSGGVIGRAVTRNLKCFHRVGFSGLVGTNHEGEAHNIILDGSIYGSTAGLFFDNYKVFRLGYVEHKNGAEYFWKNAVAWNTVGAVGQRIAGRFITDGRAQAQDTNLVPDTCISLNGWDAYSVTGSATAADSVPIGPGRLGIRLENSGGGNNYLRKNISVTVGRTYSFGCLIRETIGGGPSMGIWVRANGAASPNTYRNGPTAQGVTERINGALTIPAGTTSLDLLIGSDHTDPYDITFSDIYFVEGLVDNEAIGTAWQ